MLFRLIRIIKAIRIIYLTMNKHSKPTLLLHCCCAPCFTSVYEQLKDKYDVTIFWSNPNIYPSDEYEKRLFELRKYVKIVNVPIIVGDKMPEDRNNWELLTKNFSKIAEGGERCRRCIKMRIIYTAKYAKDNSFDFFATTLTVSPHKNSYLINNIGKQISENYGVQYLEADFKKNNGYKRSVELCREFNIYRQKYCGCQYSLK